MTANTDSSFSSPHTSLGFTLTKPYTLNKQHEAIILCSLIALHIKL